MSCWCKQLKQCCFPHFNLLTVRVFVLHRCGAFIKIVVSIRPSLRLYAHSNYRTPEHIMIKLEIVKSYKKYCSIVSNLVKIGHISSTLQVES
jgi:hypothetical protein